MAPRRGGNQPARSQSQPRPPGQGRGAASGGRPGSAGSARSGSGSSSRGAGAAPRFGNAARGAYVARAGGTPMVPGGRSRQSVTTMGFKDRDRGLGGEQVEGRQAVRELLIAGNRKVREIWVANDLDGNEIVDDIVEIAESMRVPVFEYSRKKIESEARSEAPQGVLAKAAPLVEASIADVLRPAGGAGAPGRIKPFLVAVDGVTDPGNLGALLRSAEGAGVTGVVLPKHRAVHVTPTVAKSAAGAIEYVPMVLVSGLPTALRQMKEAGIWVVGLDDGGERTLFEIGDLAVEGICLVLGAEGAGLSRLVTERCDMVVSIPMLGRLSSLNVSAAAALACYEVTRHRLAATPRN